MNRPTQRRLDCALPKVQPRRAFTILELLITVAVASILSALLLPAVSSAREAARRMECTNHLHQIGIALHAYHETAHSLPVGWQWETTHRSAYGWAVPLLPHLEQDALFAQIDRDHILQDAVNDQARGSYVSLFFCPSDISNHEFNLFAEAPGHTAEVPAASVLLVKLPTANYVGVFGTLEADDGIPAPPGEGAFIESKAIRFNELVRGLSNTLLVGERTMARVPSTWLGVDWRGEDAACRLVGSTATSPNCRNCDECEFDSRHPGGSLFLFGDGHVRMISERIDADEYRTLGVRY